MGRVIRREYIEVPNGYWDSSINVKWIVING